jgi:hypothetical protein
MPDRRYEVRVEGRLSERTRNAFAGLDVTEVTTETVIAGLVHHDEQLHELLAVVQGLGLHVVSVQQVSTTAVPPPREAQE